MLLRAAVAGAAAAKSIKNSTDYDLAIRLHRQSTDFRRNRIGAARTGSKLKSSEPSALSRPMWLRVCTPPSRVVKYPPTKILPSACSARAKTVEFAMISTVAYC